MKKYLLILLFLFPSISYAGNIASIRSNSVVVKCSVGNRGSLGSGVLFDSHKESYIISANHVFSRCKEDVKKGNHEKPCDLRMLKEIYDSNGIKQGYTEIKIDIFRRDEKLDIIILKVRKKVFTSNIKFYLDKKPPAIGETIWHVGSPYGMTLSNSLFKGIISYRDRKLFMFPSGRISRDQTNINPKPGCSGGGVFLGKDSRLIGIMVIHIRGQGLYVPIRKILAWAKKEKISWLFDPKLKKPASKHKVKEKLKVIELPDEHG